MCMMRENPMCMMREESCTVSYSFLQFRTVSYTAFAQKLHRIGATIHTRMLAKRIPSLACLVEAKFGNYFFGSSPNSRPNIGSIYS